MGQLKPKLLQPILVNFMSVAGEHHCSAEPTNALFQLHGHRVSIIDGVVQHNGTKILQGDALDWLRVRRKSATGAESSHDSWATC